MSNKLHIRVNIEYLLNSEPLHLLKAMAERAIEHLFGNGMFTGESSAEIVRWQCYVSPPRDKHVAIVRDGGGYVAFGVFDGREQAVKACAGLDAVVVRLNETTPQMRLLIQEDLRAS